jgi:DNA polymerase III alpha subunit
MVVDGIEKPTTIELLYNNDMKIREFFDKYESVKLYEACSKLEGNIRHMGMHAAGVVITPKDKPLNELVGLEKSKDTYVTCWQEGDDHADM